MRRNRELRLKSAVLLNEVEKVKEEVKRVGTENAAAEQLRAKTVGCFQLQAQTWKGEKENLEQEMMTLHEEVLEMNQHFQQANEATQAEDAERQRVFAGTKQKLRELRSSWIISRPSSQRSLGSDSAVRSKVRAVLQVFSRDIKEDSPKKQTGLDEDECSGDIDLIAPPRTNLVVSDDEKVQHRQRLPPMAKPPAVDDAETDTEDEPAASPRPLRKVEAVRASRVRGKHLCHHLRPSRLLTATGSDLLTAPRSDLLTATRSRLRSTM
jgi:hypothetical protein